MHDFQNHTQNAEKLVFKQCKKQVVHRVITNLVS
jgi:hypothetical protein